MNTFNAIRAITVILGIAGMIAGLLVLFTEPAYATDCCFAVDCNYYQEHPEACGAQCRSTTGPQSCAGGVWMDICGEWCTW